MIERGNKIYFGNELHPIVIVKINILQFQEDGNRGSEENYIILLVREERTSYLRMSTHRIGKTLKDVFEQKIFIDLFLFFIYAIL